MKHDPLNNQLIVILAKQQQMHCYEEDMIYKTYVVSTGKNGLGEVSGSECTPRGWHCIHQIFGKDNELNSVFKARIWTGEIYSHELGARWPERDWILTRILQLEGLEPGRNKFGNVDSLARFIYIHGVPDSIKLGVPGSRGCVRMRNLDVIELANWARVGARVYIA